MANSITITTPYGQAIIREVPEYRGTYESDPLLMDGNFAGGLKPQSFDGGCIYQQDGIWMILVHTHYTAALIGSHGEYGEVKGKDEQDALAELLTDQGQSAARRLIDSYYGVKD